MPRNASVTPLIAALALCLALLATPLHRYAGASEIPALDLTTSIIPSKQTRVASLIDGSIPHYAVQAELIPADGVAPARLIGSTTLSFINFTPDPMTDLFLRLYPNSPFYDGEDFMTISNVLVDGHPVEALLSEENSLATIPLPTALASGDTTTVEFDFVTTIPTDPDDSYAMLSFDTRTESFNIAYWQPLVAGWTPADGWNTGPIQTRGDPVFTNIASFTVELTTPGDIQFATTGSEVNVVDAGNGSVTRTFESGPVRDFVMIASEHYEVLEQTVGETTVRSFTFPGDADAAQLALDAAAGSLAFFNEHVGIYPYREFDQAESQIGPGAAGIEFPGLIYIDEGLYRPGSLSLVFVIAHEVAHQYFYNLVGNNQYEHAFLDEALANYTAVLFVEQEIGIDAANQVLDGYIVRPYLATLFGTSGDEIVDQPTADFSSESAYGRIVYGKGALGMHAIREAIGLEAFLEGLRLYVEQRMFDVATPADLLAAFEAVSGEDLQALWSEWFDELKGTEHFSPGQIIELGR
jgi:hypothetical protein